MSASVAVALPPEGALLANKYRIVRVLGEGGMGVVYEAVHEALSQRVAIKVLRPEILEHEELRVRFYREAKAAGQLKSRHTARVLDVETTADGLPFMVIEHLEGHDLSVEIERRGPLPIDEAARYVVQACKAMAEAHDRGIVHRDLKPSNLFLADEHGERVLKVLDFGISRIEGEDAVRVTSTKTTMGTPLYMSPEQVRSTKGVDARTDVWSLAVILYEALTGRAPFEGSAVAIGAAIVSDPVPSARDTRPEIPADLEAAIMKGLEKDPNQRFPTVRAMIDALAPFAGPSAIDSSPRIVVDPTSSQRIAVRAAAKDAGEVAQAKTIAVEPTPPRSGTKVPAILAVIVLVTAVAGSIAFYARPSSTPIAAASASASASAPASASAEPPSAPSVPSATAAPSATIAPHPPQPSVKPVRPGPAVRPPQPSATRNPVRL